MWLESQVDGKCERSAVSGERYSSVDVGGRGVGVTYDLCSEDIYLGSNILGDKNILAGLVKPLVMCAR